LDQVAIVPGPLPRARLNVAPPPWDATFSTWYIARRSCKWRPKMEITHLTFWYHFPPLLGRTGIHACPRSLGETSAGGSKPSLEYASTPTGCLAPSVGLAHVYCN
jgi:hypothetical protein